ncbi:unnamed protein product [Schistosoma mattheei]|uniref:Uncharacterized protein n=1 Tax=Schistosoma mattheei TaxID=31246 RepID=A0A3P8FV21_9TREM|nr:unnamed protein product [Schistosoma mattheei]
MPFRALTAACISRSCSNSTKQYPRGFPVITFFTITMLLILPKTSSSRLSLDSVVS